MVRVKKLGVQSKRAAAARRMVCSVFETVSGGRQETPRQLYFDYFDLEN